MYLIIAHIFRSLLSAISPRLNTEISYWVKFKRRINLKNPTTFNEKVLWLKLYYFPTHPLVKQCADKYLVRKYLQNKGFGELLNGLIAICRTPEEIEWEKFPRSFVVKLNVGCGCNLVVRDKSLLNSEESKRIIKGWLKKNLWAGYSEIQYKDVKRYILVEEYIGNPFSEKPPMDYKFYCMNGKCQYILVCVDRGLATNRTNHDVKYFFLDKEWNILPYTPEALLYTDIVIEKPACIEKAIGMAEQLALDFPFVRVDFFIEDNKIFFGELTFTPAAAMDTELCMTPPGIEKTVDEIFGETLRLS